MWAIYLKKNLKLKNLSSAENRTARFLLAGVCDSYVLYVPYVPSVACVACVGWKPRFTLRYSRSCYK